MSTPVEVVKANVGGVVNIDMINGITLTTRIKSVDDTGMVCGKLMTFVPHANPQNPGDIRVVCIPYGAPLYEYGNETWLSFDHVMIATKANSEMESSYTQHTSGITMAPASAMDALKNFDINKAAANN